MDTKARSSGTTGGTSGSTSMSLKLSDSFRRSKYESGMVKGGFKPYPHNSQLKGKSHLKVIDLDTNASQACLKTELVSFVMNLLNANSNSFSRYYSFWVK